MDEDTPREAGVSTEQRDKVRKLVEDFALGFSAKGLHAQKIDRYVEVLADVDLKELKTGLNSLKGEASLPAPNKIKERIAVAAMKAMFAREIAERSEKLRELADPTARAQLRVDRTELSRGLVGASNLLAELVSDAKKLGLVGESRAIKLLYLALHTRHFGGPGERPVSIVIKGTSSAGKSHTAKTVNQFLAPGSVVEMTGMSPKYLFYATQQGLSFAHKFVYVQETTDIDGEMEAMLRKLLSEGMIVHNTVIEQVAVTLRVEGPTGLIETTTRISIHHENETRVLSVPVNESTLQTLRVLRRIGHGPMEVDLTRWHALDEWVALGPRSAVIPFQRWIGRLAKPVAPRVRRDLTTLLCLVRAHALLHEPDRQLDVQGRVVATLDDYQVVHALTRDLFAASADLSVSKGVRETVLAVGQLLIKKQAGDGFVMSAEIGAYLRSARGVVNRNINDALEKEHLNEINPSRSETAPHRVRLGSRPLPDKDESIFPTRDQIANAMGGNGSARIEAPTELELDDHEEADGHLIF